MEKTNLIFLSLSIILLIILGYTLYNINHFTPIIKSCDDDFAVINKCGCIPWDNEDSIAVFGRNSSLYQKVNFSEVKDG